MPSRVPPWQAGCDGVQTVGARACTRHLASSVLTLTGAGATNGSMYA